jgi:hypothetical protein
MSDPLLMSDPLAYRAGAARARITPDRPCWIAGYESNRRSEGIHSDLYAAALVLEAGAERAAFVALDLIGLPLPLVRRIRQGVAAVPPGRLLLACSHTHSGPDTIGIWGPEPGATGIDEGYLRFLEETILRVVDEAAQSLRPAEIRFATASLDGVSRNDRIPGILDKECALLRIAGESGEPIASAVHFACHPEAMRCRLVSSDFLSVWYDRATNEGFGVPLFFNGALGGMVTADIPAVPTPEDQIRETERLGKRFYEGLAELKDRATEAEPDPFRRISFRRKVVSVPLFNEKFKEMEASGVVPPRFERGTVETEISHLRIGSSEWVALPGEPTPDIGLYLKRRMSGSPKFVLGLCDDEIGYLLCEEHWGIPLFAYESSMCAGPEAGRRLEAALLEMMEA